MQGIWKENISGYTKDSKRKKQSRKHTLKDKAKWHIKHTQYSRKGKCESNKTFVEGDILVVPDQIKQHKELYINICLISVIYDTFDFSYSKIKLVFQYRNDYYDFYTKELITRSTDLLTVLDIMYLDWDEDLELIDRPGYYGSSTRETLFLYGRPLPVDYWNMFGFYSTKDRKIAQKKANSMDRQRVREYISKFDWDAEIKTHALSKSILWEIW